MWLLAAYSVAVGAWTLSANAGMAHSLPLYFQGIFVGDKVVHFVVVGVFALIVARAIRSVGVHPWRSLLSGMAIAMVLATFEEATNALTPHRCCSVLDLAADLAGVIVLGAIGWLSGFRSRPLSFARPGYVRQHGLTTV